MRPRIPRVDAMDTFGRSRQTFSMHQDFSGEVDMALLREMPGKEARHREVRDHITEGLPAFREEREVVRRLRIQYRIDVKMIVEPGCAEEIDPETLYPATGPIAQVGIKDFFRNDERRTAELTVGNPSILGIFDFHCIAFVNRDHFIGPDSPTSEFHNLVCHLNAPERCLTQKIRPLRAYVAACKRSMAEAERFELSMPCDMPPFQGGGINHYPTPPCSV